MLIFIIFLVPEMTGRSLEEVDELFDRKVPAWRFASTQTHGVGRRIAEIEGSKAQNDKMDIEHVGNVEQATKHRE